ncbi:MAG: protein BatD [Gammaproteobacteria bacterium]|nr:protein BatD [Gammaproteobacteria bacterium]
MSQFTHHLVPLQALVKSIGFSLLLLTPMLSFADKMTASIDRKTIEMGDIITLTIETDFQTYGRQPGLEKLKDLFEVLGQQQSNQIQLINGSFNSISRWQIKLLAKQPGKYTLPAFKLGDVQSNSLQLNISPVQPKTANQFGDYTLTSEVNKQTAYVQEEVIYTLRLYFLGSLSGNIRPPKFGEALSITLKDQSIYGKEIQGQAYTVYEWVYALYPQKSGEMTIPGPLFTGIQQYRNRQKGVQEIATLQKIRVLPVPSSFAQNADNTWLPAREVQLTESWELDPTDQPLLKVGDSLNRTLTLSVKGLLSSQLPNLKPINHSDFKIYTDKEKTTQTTLEEGIQSTLIQKQVIILKQPGLVTLPEQHITWWNTQTQKIEVTRIPAQHFEVNPTPVTATNPSQVQPSEPTQNIQSSSKVSSTVESISKGKQGDVSRETSLFWKLVSLALGLLLLVTLFLLLWLRHKHRKQSKALMLASIEQQDTLAVVTEGLNITPLTSLCTEAKKMTDTPHQTFYQTLRSTLSEQFDLHSVSQLTHEPLRQKIEQLEAHLFSQANISESIQTDICTAFNDFAKSHHRAEKQQQRNAIKQSGKQQLKALYPTDTQE